MASYSDEGFEQLAKTARSQLGIDDLTKVGAIDFLRRLKHAGYIMDYVRLPDLACRTTKPNTIRATKKSTFGKAYIAAPQTVTPNTASLFFTKERTRCSVINTSASGAFQPRPK